MNILDYAPGSVFDLAFLVDQRVNIVKDKTIGEALELIVPVEKRQAVREELVRWHGDRWREKAG